MENIENWVFDLDNTLYKAECGLFDKVHILMGKFIEEKLNMSSNDAQQLRSKYYHQYGTTLRGLMSEHNINPDDYLKYVHQINYDVVEPDIDLGNEIKKLNGKKYIFTNANLEHAEIVLEKLGMSSIFDGIFDISDGDYYPKPLIRVYEDFTKKFKIENSNTAMFEDLHINLESAHKLGWKTVWITNNVEYNLNKDVKIHKDIEKVFNEKNYIDYVTNNLKQFLKEL